MIDEIHAEFKNSVFFATPAHRPEPAKKGNNQLLKGQVNMEEYIIVSSGVVISGLKLNTDMTVLSGGKVMNTVVSNGGSLDVHCGGVAENTAVFSGGELTVWSCGTAMKIIENGGNVEIKDGATVSFAPNTIRNLQLIDDGRERYDCIRATVHSGTIADSTEIFADSVLEVYSCGIVKNTAVSSGGDLSVRSGGRMEHTTVSRGGRLSLESGSVANHTVVSAGGEFYVYSGATATGIIEKGGHVRVNEGATVTFASSVLRDMVLTDCANTTIHSGTIASGVTIRKDKLDVCSGGRAKDTTISGGVLVAREGSITENTTIFSGVLHIMSGGTATGIQAEKGARIILHAISPDTCAQGTFNGSSFDIHGVISSCVLMERNPFDTVGHLFDEMEELDVFSGGTAVNVTVSSGGELRISSGGLAEMPTVCSGGRLIVLNGGSAHGVIKEDSAAIETEDGAVVFFTDE